MKTLLACVASSKRFMKTALKIISLTRMMTPAVMVSLLLPALALASPQFKSEAVNFRLTEVNPQYFSGSLTSPSIAVQQVATASGEFDRLSIADELTIGRPGWPDLPLISRTILIPPTGDVILHVKNVVSREESGIRPLSAPPEDIDDPTAAEPSDAFLNSDGWFPPDPIRIDQPAIMRGYRMVTVYTFPIQYNPLSGMTRFNDKIEYDLEFSGVGENEVANPGRIPATFAVRRALESMVVNPPRFPEHDAIITGNYLYVAVGNQSILDALNPLVEWRRRMGHKTTVATVAGNAGIATIRAAIQNAYDSDTPPEFVCLVGDAAGGDLALAAATQTGDYEYSRLDGNDPLPDVAIGRLSAATVAQLRSIVTKIVSYESNPYMGNTDWYRQAQVVAGHVGNGIGEVHLAHWVRMQLEAYGFEDIRGWYWDEDGEAENNQPFLTEAFRWGISILHYRAFSHMNQLPLAVLTNLPNEDGRWPAVLAISCNTGNFVAETNGNYQGIGMTEEFLRARGGGIGAIGTATGETNVRFNNLVAAGIWKGVYEKRMYCLGWGLNQGKYEIWRAYHGFDDGYSRFMDWNNLMGDPGTSIWTDVPQRIEVAHAANIPISSNLVTVEVTDEAGGEPVADAQVCVYREDEFQVVGKTDADGRAWLTMPDGVEAGDALITVVKHNVFPYLGEINFAEPATQLTFQSFTIDDDQEGGSSGNDDGVINPGERIELTCQLVNAGRNQIQGNCIVTVTSLSQFAEVIDGEQNLDAIPAPGESVELQFIVELDESAPNNDPVRFEFSVSTGAGIWRSVADYFVAAPDIAIQSYELADNVLEPGQIKTLNILVNNGGGFALEPSTVRLISTQDALTVIDDQSTFPRVPINGTRGLNGNLFRLRAHPLAVPGTKCDLILEVTTESGFVDSAFFSLQLGQARDGDPFGPDRYGYACYDSEDDDWDMKPVFDWLEINPNIQGRDFNGTVLNLTDRGDNEDAAIMVNMPFDFQYYGQEYRQLTICSNGWAAFGNQASIGNFRNQHIAQALAPKAMLAVWWDNLITIPNTSSIVTYYDRNGGRFIVEWSQMRRLVEAGQGAVETFQLILYDPAVHETITGDGKITYQYHTVTNQNLIAHNDIPYCTIGISTPDGMDGMEYTYWNTYAPGATRIANSLAITFTTEASTRTGIIEGVIRDAETGAPIPNAQVLTTRSFWAETDEDGYYRIDDILVGEDYTLTASALGWNDSTLTGFDVVEDEVLNVDFTLLHPEFRLSHERLQRDITIGLSVETELTIFNDGNGLLTWESVPNIIQEEERPMWEFIESIPIGQIADDDRIEGGIFADEHFFVCGANSADPNMIYKISRDGQLVSSFEQPGTSNYGLKDLAFDGELIWGSGEDSIFGISTEGEVVARFLGPQSPHSAIAYDGDRGWLWTSTVTTAIMAVDRDGNRVGRSIPNRLLRIYGLSYNPADEAGKCLYAHTRERDTDRQIIYRVNPDAGELQLFHVLDPAGPGVPTGADISGIYDPTDWVYLSIENTSLNDGRDRLDIYQIAQRADWMSPEPQSGTIEPDENQEIVLTIGAYDLPVMRLEGDLNFIHNAALGRTSLPISIDIVAGPGGMTERTWMLNRGWNLMSLNITPINLDIVRMMEPLVEDGILGMVKDGFGRFYNPANEFNNIPNYDTTSAYQVFVNDGGFLLVRGTVIAPDAAIPLRQGWNMTAYYPRDPVEATAALSNLGESLLIAKDIAGHFYLPAYDFNSLGTFAENEGYLIKVSDNVDLVWNVVAGGDRVAAESQPPEHYTSLPSSIDNHSLLLIGTNDMAGWEAAFFDDDGRTIVAGRFDGSGRCGLAIPGDAPDTEVIEGIARNQSFNVKLWNGIEEMEAGTEPVEGEMKWSRDGITVARLTPIQIPVEFGLEGVYPNPFNSMTRVAFGLAEAGNIDLAVYDLAGRRVAQLANGIFKPGHHAVVWNGNGIPSGIYILRLGDGDAVSTRKVTLIR